MAETPYVETEVLLALLNEDEEHAIELIRGMSESERAQLGAVTRLMRLMLSPQSWCPGCGEYVDHRGTVLSLLAERDGWHVACREQHRAAIEHASNTLRHVAERNPRWGH